MDTAVETAVLGSEIPSERAAKALRNIRVGKWSHLRLFHLLDEEDGGTVAEPFKQLAKLTPTQAESKLNKVLKVLLIAVANAVPEKAGNALRFFNALFDRLGAALLDGVPVADVANFYRKTMAKVAAPAREYRLGVSVGGGGALFDMKFVKGWSEAREEFDRARGKTDARNEAQKFKRGREDDDRRDPKKGKKNKKVKGAQPTSPTGGGNGAPAKGKTIDKVIAANKQAGERHADADSAVKKHGGDKKLLEEFRKEHPPAEYAGCKNCAVCWDFWHGQGCKNAKCTYAHQ